MTFEGKVTKYWFETYKKLPSQEMWELLCFLQEVVIPDLKKTRTKAK